jgi:hypothetical protein
VFPEISPLSVKNPVIGSARDKVHCGYQLIDSRVILGLRRTILYVGFGETMIKTHFLTSSKVRKTLL